MRYNNVTVLQNYGIMDNVPVLPARRALIHCNFYQIYRSVLEFVLFFTELYPGCCNVGALALNNFWYMYFSRMHETGDYCDPFIVRKTLGV